MPGCDWGFSVSAELTVASVDPLDKVVAVRPDELARALSRALKGMTCETSAGTHGIKEIHIYRVSPTLASLRRALALPTPWIDRATGKLLPLPAAARKRAPAQGPVPKVPAPRTTARRATKKG